MLIEFSVSNFRSFREKQTFQMTAVPRLAKKENTFAPDVVGEKLPSLLKVAAIYGANASGKSSLIQALGMIEKLARIKPDAVSDGLPVRPFRFDKDLLDKPSLFEAHFIAGKMRYQFKVGATRDRITEELLIAYPRGKETLLYSRKHINESDHYEFGDTFDAADALRDIWRRVTGPQSLFISQAVANSSEELKQLRTPFEWISHGLFVFDDGPSQLYHLGGRLPVDEEMHSQISAFLQDVDVPVTGIRLEPNKSEQYKSSDQKSADRVLPSRKITLTHETRLGAAEFDISEESGGTRNLIGIWLPWSIITGSLGESPVKYGTLVIDEFDSSLHPELVEHLVSKHIASGTKSQLIFTTHDTHLMGIKLLRRDQLWLTDRNSSGATRLTSIHSFDGRESEDVEKRYFEGRYRGLPIRRGN
jgi:energy-coupling factor transporter ATP-binding protein EcfA2